MINFQEELNNEQLDVVRNGDGPCLVLAGAGSGKTRTITYRVAYLLEQGIQPDEILLVTFTNKAAREMIERVQALTHGTAKLPWSGTFHSIAYKMLRKYAPLLGYNNNFTILDSSDSTDLLKLCIKGEGIDRTQKRFPSPKVIQSIISYARNAETTIVDVLEREHPQWISLEDTFIRIAENYATRKRDAQVMDFDDLLVNLYLLLLKEQKLCTTFATQFKYVLVDEYQDTNKVQASIIKQFAQIHKNLLVVGDDAQSIYSFRAADIQNILNFEKEYPDAKVFKLESNYRSTPDILFVANDVIAQNTHQYTKELRAVRDAFTKPEVHAFYDGEAEAEFIANRILELIQEGVPLDEIAVLFRAAFHSQMLEMQLTKHNIPYEFRGGMRFFERGHVKDVLAYLRIFHNRHDAVAWSRVLNMQVGIGPAGAEKVYAYISGSSESYEMVLSDVGAMLSARGQVGWSEFRSIFGDMLSVEQSNPAFLIDALLSSKYVSYLEAEYPDFRERMQDIEQLGLFAKKYDDMQAFLGEASLQESYTRGQSASDNSEEEKIILSTIHQAKGLEWQAVFIMNVAAGQFPSERSSGEREREEERRLFYVAVTRAKKYLYMSYPLVTRGYSTLQGPSPFLEELDRNLVVREELGSEANVFYDPSDDEDDITYEPMDDDKPVRSFLKSIDEL